MPDHLHLLCCGLSELTDQRVAIKFLRKNLNLSLKTIGYELQSQPYDHVLREEQCERSAIEDVAEYITRNPERKALVPLDGFANYPHTGCLLPGYPNLRLFQDESWDVVWRTLDFLKRTACFRQPDPNYRTKP